MSSKDADMPSDISGRLSVFDRFATHVTFLLVALPQNTQKRAVGLEDRESSR